MSINELDKSHRVCYANPDDSLLKVIQSMGSDQINTSSIALITDSSQRLLGVINNGDVIRLISQGHSLDACAHDVMNTDPIVIGLEEQGEQLIESIRRKTFAKNPFARSITRYVPQLDENGVVVSVVDTLSVLNDLATQSENIQVFGLGFVGLTLSAVIASRGHYVTGIDTNQGLIDRLRLSKPHILEPRLEDMLIKLQADGNLHFDSHTPTLHHSVSIVAVGTPIFDSGEVSLTALSSVCAQLSKTLKRGDLVMLRSTVPLGTTRNMYVRF